MGEQGMACIFDKFTKELFQQVEPPLRPFRSAVHPLSLSEAPVTGSWLKHKEELKRSRGRSCHWYNLFLSSSKLRASSPLSVASYFLTVDTFLPEEVCLFSVELIWPLETLPKVPGLAPAVRLWTRSILSTLVSLLPETAARLEDPLDRPKKVELEN